MSGDPSIVPLSFVEGYAGLASLRLLVWPLPPFVSHSSDKVTPPLGDLSALPITSYLWTSLSGLNDSFRPLDNTFSFALSRSFSGVLCSAIVVPLPRSPSSMDVSLKNPPSHSSVSRLEAPLLAFFFFFRLLLGVDRFPPPMESLVDSLVSFLTLFFCFRLVVEPPPPPLDSGYFS